MKKKGFTLIELLAVIVVLAIIALIATPIVMNAIEKSKKGAAERSADSYIGAVETTVATERLDGNEVQNGTYEIDGEGNLTGKGLPNNKLVIDMKGNKPTSGTITIKDGQVTTDTTMTIGDYDIAYNPTTKKYEATKVSSYKKYSDGEVVYFNPTTGKKCTADEVEENYSYYNEEKHLSCSAETIYYDGHNECSYDDYLYFTNCIVPGDMAPEYCSTLSTDTYYCTEMISCEKYSYSNSDSCLKFNTFNDSENSSTVNLFSINPVKYLYGMDEWDYDDEVDKASKNWNGVETPDDISYTCNVSQEWIDYGHDKNFAETKSYAGKKARSLHISDITESNDCIYDGKITHPSFINNSLAYNIYINVGTYAGFAYSNLGYNLKNGNIEGYYTSSSYNMFSINPVIKVKKDKLK